MPTYQVTDTVFEDAVDADLHDRATPPQTALIHADPHAWRAALAARMWVLEAVQNKTVALPEHTAVHDKAGIFRTFANEARARTMQRQSQLKDAIRIRITHARQISREMAADLDAHEAESLRRIVAYATTLVPASEARFWEMVDGFCERHRNGAPFVHRDRSLKPTPNSPAVRAEAPNAART
jgi:hypothetical protein